MSREVTHDAQGPTVVDPDEHDGDIYVCACGLSDEKPFCDGSHRATADEADDVVYSGSKAKAHPFTGVDEADNGESLHARSHGWIFHAEMPNVYVSKNTMLTYGESGRHSNTQSEYPQPLASL